MVKNYVYRGREATIYCKDFIALPGGPARPAGQFQENGSCLISVFRI
jgi:hypothetical protein